MDIYTYMYIYIYNVTYAYVCRYIYIIYNVYIYMYIHTCKKYADKYGLYSLSRSFAEWEIRGSLYCVDIFESS